jgi:hypothetical protein
MQSFPATWNEASVLFHLISSSPLPGVPAAAFARSVALFQVFAIALW